MKNYEKPVVSITEFTNEDIITASGNGLQVDKMIANGASIGENVIDF